MQKVSTDVKGISTQGIKHEQERFVQNLVIMGMYLKNKK